MLFASVTEVRLVSGIYVAEFSELKAAIDFLPSAKQAFHSDCMANPHRTLPQVVLVVGLGLMFSVALVAPCEEKPPCLDGIYRQRPPEHLHPRCPPGLWLRRFPYVMPGVSRLRPMHSKVVKDHSWHRGSRWKL